MKITQELIDNGNKIIHINYEKSDIKRLKQMHEEHIAMLQNQQNTNVVQEEGND